MIARQETTKDTLWTALAAPLPPEVIQWRQQGKPTQRDGRWIARFVAYIDAQFVRARLDEVAPGEWDLTLSEPLKELLGTDGESVDDENRVSFRARLSILGVNRESIGSGRDYKTAETDAFKRAAVRFGIGAELYAMDLLWVQVDGDGKFAKPVEDPAAVYARKHGGQGAARPQTATSAQPTTGSPAPQPAPVASSPASTHGASNGTAKAASGDEETCPKCAGRMWDNRFTKKNPKAPDFKCRDRSCDGVIWPPKGEKVTAKVEQDEPDDDAPPHDDDDLPF